MRDPLDPNVWLKPITPEDQQEIKARLAEHPRDVPFACFNDDERLKLVFPVMEPVEATQ